MSRHYMALSRVNPLISRKEYNKYCIPIYGITIEDYNDEFIRLNIIILIFFIIVLYRF